MFFKILVLRIFGRIEISGNQELFGRITDVPWGIYVNGFFFFFQQDWV